MPLPPEPMIYTGIHTSTGHSLGLVKCMMARIHWHSAVQKGFTALKVLYVSIPPSLMPWRLLPYYRLHDFSFSRLSSSWTHTVVRLAFFTYECAFKFPLCPFRTWYHSTLSLSNAGFFECTTVSIHPTERCQGCFQVLKIIASAALNVCMQCFVWSFSFL